MVERLAQPTEEIHTYVILILFKLSVGINH
jgi:hypothetical protein